MPRYIRRLPRIGHSLGPSEERNFEMWVGYEVDGVDDPAALGLVDVRDWTDDRLRELGVVTFKRVTPEELERWKS